MIPTTLHHLIDFTRDRQPDAAALRCRGDTMSYRELADRQDRFASAIQADGIVRGQRVAVMLGKSFEFVAAVFGTAKAGATFVPLNPVLKPAQVGHVLRDSGTRVLVLSPERWLLLRDELTRCPSVQRVVVVGNVPDGAHADNAYAMVRWRDFIDCGCIDAAMAVDNDVAAIFYTSGSTGRAKGVVLSHRNMVSGAISVASYLENRASDRILAVLPLSFDAGFSQLTTGFLVGACVVLLDYLLPQEVARVMATECITGLTAVPPLYAQLVAHEWSLEAGAHLRYFASTGGRMPREILARLRSRLPRAKPYLMYGLTEAFRSTYLDPAQIDLRPDSIGKAIPNQEILVIGDDGRPCAADQPGELVHRGSTVALGYWGDERLTSERFKPLVGCPKGLASPEIGVFSGDIVRRDSEGYLYFIGRRDDMIKHNGYRISPTEIEEAAYDSGLIAEAAAVGVEHGAVGHLIVLFLVAAPGAHADDASMLSWLRKHLPPYMTPSRLVWSHQSLPRNANGKMDRRKLQATAEVENGALEMAAN